MLCCNGFDHTKRKGAASAGIHGVQPFQSLPPKPAADLEVGHHECTSPLSDGYAVVNVIIMTMTHEDMICRDRIHVNTRRQWIRTDERIE